MDSEFPMRINKYLAHQKYCTRREADVLIQQGKVMINGRRAVLGDKVQEGDRVEVTFKPRKYKYYAYNKPRGIITHSAQEGEEEIADVSPIEGVFPVGRLDKDSHGLIILTDDGRLTDALLNPDNAHDKEYEVKLKDAPPESFAEKMARGVNIGDYITKPCIVNMIGEKKFSIILSEGKKHQIRRMCGFFGQSAIDLKRVRILNIKLAGLKEGESRKIEGDELKQFLKLLGF